MHASPSYLMVLHSLYHRVLYLIISTFYVEKHASSDVRDLFLRTASLFFAYTSVQNASSQGFPALAVSLMYTVKLFLDTVLKTSANSLYF